MDHQQSLKIFRDNQNTYNYAKENAFIEGEIEGLKKAKLKAKLKANKKRHLTLRNL